MSKTTRTLLAAALLGALAAPALAQDDNPMASTQYPPSPGLSAEGLAQPLNSLPTSAATALRTRPGSDVETTPTGPAATAGLARDAADAPAITAPAG